MISWLSYATHLTHRTLTSDNVDSLKYSHKISQLVKVLGGLKIVGGKVLNMKLVLVIFVLLNFISSLASSSRGNPELIAELLNKKTQSHVES